MSTGDEVALSAQGPSMACFPPRIRLTDPRCQHSRKPGRPGFGPGDDMGNIDAFSAQIVRLVREMPDEAILDLVKHQLGALKIGRGREGARRPARAARAAAKKAAAKPKNKRETAPAGKRRPGPARRAIAVSAERQVMLDNVERLVKQSSGLSASDVAKAAGVPQTRAAAALKELKLAKRIFQGGDRRFARYAGDSKTA